jgi:hypothetical protein
VALAACALGATAHAQADAEYLPPLLCDALARQDASPEQLLPHLQRCQRSSTYLAHLGHQLNRQQRYLEAAEHPSAPSCSTPTPPPPRWTTPSPWPVGTPLGPAAHCRPAGAHRPAARQRSALQATRAHWAQAADTRLQQTRLQAYLRWGWDNNLLGAPNLSSLTLTFPTEAIQLLLDESNRPRPGSYQRADLRLDHTLVQSGGTRWDIGLALLQRHSAAVPEASRQLEAQLERSQGAHYPPPAAPG